MLLVSSVIEKFVGYPETPRRLAHYQYPVCHSRSEMIGRRHLPLMPLRKEANCTGKKDFEAFG